MCRPPLRDSINRISGLQGLRLHRSPELFDTPYAAEIGPADLNAPRIPPSRLMLSLGCWLALESTGLGPLDWAVLAWLWALCSMLWAGWVAAKPPRGKANEGMQNTVALLACSSGSTGCPQEAQARYKGLLACLFDCRQFVGSNTILLATNSDPSLFAL